MNVVLLGSGGREHALAYSISKSESLTKLFCLPGNPGMKDLGELVNLSPSHQDEVLEFCKNNDVKLVVVGPEQPLVDGIANKLRDEGIAVFGPDKDAAMIEGDKSFSKNLMKKYDIPTAAYEIFKAEELNDAINYLENSKFPIVIKASGLAAGKGVLICENLEDAVAGLKEIMSDKVFGSAGDEVVIEEFMVGLETSIFAITDGEDYICLPASQDHKRALDGDKGKNTGGMGAYAPAPLVTEELQKQIEELVITPTINAMKSEGKTYQGCLYAGLMITNEGPKVVEFNCRFGDPETQAVLPLLQGDFLKLLYSSAIGKIDKTAVQYNGGSAICVVVASGGYPASYEKGFEIKGLEFQDDNLIVYHAGTKSVDGKIVTNGGRVLGVTSVIAENDLKKCKDSVYNAITNISFDGMFYRKDISDKASLSI